MDYRKLALPGNSNASKAAANEEKPKMKKVIQGKVVGKRKDPVRDIASLIFVEDLKSIKEYILFEVLIPSLKQGVANTVNMMLFGEAKSPVKPSSTGNIPYSSISRIGFTPKRANIAQSRFFFENPIVDSEEDAKLVITHLKDVIEAKEQVSVADLYSMLGLPTKPTYYEHGWSAIGNAKPIQINDGWVINLPKPIVLN